MIQLLNKFAWGLSILLGFLLVSLFERIDLEVSFIALFLAAIIKGIFFSRAYIGSRVEHFSRVAYEQQKQDTTIPKDSSEVYNPSDDFSHNFSDTSPEKAEVSDAYIAENVKEEKISYTPMQEKNHNTIKDEEVSELGKFFTKFFSENILAKIGGILVFLGVIFLLSLLWNAIPGVLKLIIGFLIGMLCYISGIKLDSKKIYNEARILMGTGILINYAVILSGRYIIGETSIDPTPLLSTGISFVFLILNTIFAVLTSLYYKSSPLLVFSFLFAFFNPLLVGTLEDAGILILGYYLIISSAALFLAQKRESLLLLLMVFILGNISIISIANGSISHMSETSYMAKYISIIFISLSSLLSAIKMNFGQKRIVELLFGGAFFTVGTFGFLGAPNDLSTHAYLLNFIVGLGFMGFSYYHIRQWKSLYSLGTLGSALILGTHINWMTTDLLWFNIIALLIFIVMNIGAALFIAKNYLDSQKSLQDLVFGTVTGVGFIAFSIYAYAQAQNETIIFIGFLYFVIALVYFVLSYVLVQKIGIISLKENVQSQNAIYNFLAISLSLLSISLALIFSDYVFVVAILWLLESAILFALYHKIGSIKIAFVALILMFFGLGELIYDYIQYENQLEAAYMYLAPIILIALTLGANTLLTEKKESSPVRIAHDFLHIIGTITILGLITAVFIFDTNILFLVLAICSNILIVLYNKIGSALQRSSFVFIICFIYLAHILYFGSSFPSNNTILESIFFQYLISLIFAFSAFMTSKFGKSCSQWSAFIFFTLGYLFIITTLYVHHLFPNVFAITLYWGLIAFTLVSTGIQRDIIEFRTIGLYLVILVCAKILFIDISTGINDSIVRVIAFILVGIMFIIIGTMYTRKYGNQLKGEFQLSNLLGTSLPGRETPIPQEKKTPASENLNQVIASIDISAMRSVTFKPNGGRMFITKSKNLMKITKLIMKRRQQAHFQAGELQPYYDYIVENYSSSLNKTELTRVQNALKSFVDAGGEIIIK